MYSHEPMQLMVVKYARTLNSVNVKQDEDKNQDVKTNGLGNDKV